MATQTLRATPGLAEQASTRMAFFVAGLGIAAWAPLVPFVKARLGLDEATLGVILLCLGLGSLISMPISGILAGKYGCKRVIIVASIVICITLPILAVVNNIPLLAVTLMLFGAGVGTIDVTVNTQAVIVEKASGRSMMSGFHGLYSLGGIVGPLLISAILSLGFAPLVTSLAVALLIAALLWRYAGDLLPYAAESDAPLFVMPRGVVIFIGVICFVCFLAEGVVLDWGAVYLFENKQAPENFAALGYMIFSIAMTLCRFYGDRVVPKLGSKNVILFGGLITALGFAIVVLMPFWAFSLLGFLLIGIGASNIVPIFFTVAGNQSFMPPNLAIAAVTLMGYGGILLGPALVGFIANATSLSVSLMVIAAGMLFVASSWKVAVK
jgi:MFS family permease